MGKVMSLINTTPDGFVDGKYAIIDAEFYEFTHGLLSDTRTVAFGCNTFERNKFGNRREFRANPNVFRKVHGK